MHATMNVQSLAETRAIDISSQQSNYINKLLMSSNYTGITLTKIRHVVLFVLIQKSFTDTRVILVKAACSLATKQ